MFSESGPPSVLEYVGMDAILFIMPGWCWRFSFSRDPPPIDVTEGARFGGGGLGGGTWGSVFTLGVFVLIGGVAGCTGGGACCTGRMDCCTGGGACCAGGGVREYDLTGGGVAGVTGGEEPSLLMLIVSVFAAKVFSI